jgi:hypothetical protein
VGERKESRTAPVPRGSFVPTERFSADMLEEVPRQHVIDVLELYARAMAIPPQWAVERWSQNLERWSQQPKRGHPKRNVLVDTIRCVAVKRCAIRGQDKYKLAAAFLKRIPSQLFCGLSVTASPSAIKKSCLAAVNDEALLRHYLPLLAEAMDHGPFNTE